MRTQLYLYFSYLNNGGNETFPQFVEGKTLQATLNGFSSFSINLASFVKPNTAKLNHKEGVVCGDLDFQALEDEALKNLTAIKSNLEVFLVYPEELHPTYLVTAKEDNFTDFDGGISHRQITQFLSNVQKIFPQQIKVRVISKLEDKVQEEIKNDIESKFAANVVLDPSKRVRFENINSANEPSSATLQANNEAPERTSGLKRNHTKAQCCVIS